MRGRFKRTRERVKKKVALIWKHRAGYAGLTIAYGAGCLGIIDKENVAQIVTAIYAAMAAQRH